MMTILHAFWLTMAFFSSCAVEEEPDSALDCGRQFILATYNGNFKRAGQLIYPETENAKRLETAYETAFRAKSSFDKQTLSESTLVVLEWRQMAANEFMMVFNNALYKAADSIIIQRYEENWRVLLPESKL